MTPAETARDDAPAPEDEAPAAAVDPADPAAVDPVGEAAVDPAGEAEDEEPWQIRFAKDNDRDILILSVFVVVMAFILQVTPARDGVTLFGARLPESCGTKRMGWGDCPGCGLTRSFILGVRLDSAAFELHPAGPVLLLFVIGQIPYRSWRFYKRRRLRRDELVDLRFGRWRLFWKFVQGGIFLFIFLAWVYRRGWFT